MDQRRRGSRARSCYCFHQFKYALAAHGNSGNHRDAQLFFESLRIYLDAFVGGHVPEIEGNYRRQPPLQDLQREVEVALQVGGVDYVYYYVRSLGEDLAGDLLHIGGRVQRVYSGRVHERRHLLAQLHAPFRVLYGGAGVVGRDYLDSGKPGKDHALSHIGVSHEEDLQGRGLQGFGFQGSGFLSLRFQV